MARPNDRKLPAIFAALAVVLAAAALPSTARNLPPVDAVADSAPPVATKRAAAGVPGMVSKLHRHDVLDLPTLALFAPGRAVAKSLAVPGSAYAIREQLRELAPLYRMAPGEFDALPAGRSETLAGGGALHRFASQRDGIEVFREGLTVLAGTDGIARAASGTIGPTAGAEALAPGASAYHRLGAAQAIAVALGDYRFDAAVAARLVAQPAAKSLDAHRVAGYEYHALPAGELSPDGATMDEPARAKRVWFRLPEGLVPAWYVELQMGETRLPGSDFYAYVIGADEGRLLFRHNQTADAAFAYRVYAEPTGINLPFPSPTGRGLFPHPTGVNDGTTPVFVPPNLVTLQNGPISTGDPWLAPGATVTTGNNVEAWANRFGPAPAVAGNDPNDGTFNANGLVECNLAETGAGDFHACVTSPGAFDHTFNPNAAPVAPRTQAMSTVVNLFYLNNWLHDWYYDAGFKEADGNAQADNFGRGGLGNDSIRAQALDYGGVNNANMSTPADGARPRMRMYVFLGAGAAAVSETSPTPADYAAGTGTFGSQAFDLSALLVQGLDAADGSGPLTTDGCTALTNAAQVAGKIALIDRGTCGFVVKAKNAQDAGAVGVIIVDNVTAPVANMAGADPTVTIPALRITLADGNTLKAQLAGAVTLRMRRLIGNDRDGSVDTTIVAHEWGHYISNRLVGNSVGLTTNHSRGLGEGWADFHSLLLLAKAGDNPDAVYPVGTYVLDGPQIAGATFSQTNYYGIRRYPYSANLAKNPLTLTHIQNSVALPASPPPASTGTNSEVHNTGEVWASMLWQCYTNLLKDTGRLTFAQAQDRMKRALVAGYKLTPPTPTILEARDAVVAAMGANDPADAALCFAGFATRGAGVDAAAMADRYTTTNNGVTESFSAGGDLAIDAIVVDPRAGQYCDADGFLDNGENVPVKVTLRNAGGIALSGATVSLSTPTAGITFPFGSTVAVPTLGPGQSATVTVRIAASGVSVAASVTLTATASHPSLAFPLAAKGTVVVQVNGDAAAAASGLDTVEAGTTAWTSSLAPGTSDASQAWTIRDDGTGNRAWFARTGVSAAGLAYLVSPPITLAAGTKTLTFKHRHAFEFGSGSNFDGGVIEYSIDGGTTWTDVFTLDAAAYNGGLITKYTGTLNPLVSSAAGNRPGFVAESTGWPAYTTKSITLGSGFAAGTVMRLRFGAGSDGPDAFGGWDVDDISVTPVQGNPFTGLVADTQTCVAASAFAGTPQTAATGVAFLQPLVARVLRAAQPVAGASVTFSAPVSGASGTFAGGGTSATATSDASGYATSPFFTANAIGGAYNVVATAGVATASFVLNNVAQYTLTVSKPGTGSGTVTSTPAGIDCGATCAAAYADGTVVSLSQAATPGSTFTGWSGACLGTGACVVTMSAARSVSASFSTTSTTADLSVALSAAPSPGFTGKDVTYLATVTNLGPSAASGVVLNDVLPGGVAFVWASPGCSFVAGTVSCSIGSLAANASAQRKIVVRPSAAGTVSNGVSAVSSNPDPNLGNNAIEIPVSVSTSPAGVAVTRYRLFSPVTSEHLYTTDLNEYNVLGTFVGTWVQEGAIGKVFNNPGSFGGVAATPYYRLYNTSNAQHHWTTDPNEYYTLILFPQYNSEGVDGYIFPTQAVGTIPLFRLLYPFSVPVAGLHHWTIDPVEYSQLISVYGWVGEGGSGFVIP